MAAERTTDQPPLTALVMCPVAECIKHLKWCSQVCGASSSVTTAVTQEIIQPGKRQHGGGSTVQDV